MLLSRVVKAAIVLDCTRFPAVSKHGPQDAALPNAPKATAFGNHDLTRK
jgi:hypothetical protein